MKRTDALDLDHVDGTRKLSHALCNRRAGGMLGAAARRDGTTRDPEPPQGPVVA
jgi:hypothetical protein